MFFFFFFQAEDGIRDLVRSRGLGDVYKRQWITCATSLYLTPPPLASAGPPPTCASWTHPRSSAPSASSPSGATSTNAPTAMSCARAARSRWETSAPSAGR
eukprot:TRINITY_DN500_c0_g1_i3.p3 TRINITY_DN500_c0_g1~~TRINITY_DN500_c0_g1_i3.p3  ORF type:complete len:101 (-),score=30.56 TRINITY_DN500_c0_g1_i3:767-1069(-)